MISLIFLISYFRVPKEVGKLYYIPKFDDDNITDFIKESSTSIVIFTNNISNYEFTNFAISKYGRFMNFSIATQEAAEKLEIEKFPSIVQFHKSSFFSYFRGYQSSTLFALWCREIHENQTKTHTINDFEDLRFIFESRSTVLLGVENTKPPKEYKNDIKFVSVKSNLFSFFNLSVVPGYYIYRGIDRQFIEVKRNYHSYTHSSLVDVEREDIRKKPFFCGYFIDVLGNSSSTELTILQTLASKKKEFFFGPLSGSAANYMATFGQLNYFRTPFLVVWNTSDVSKHRWTLFDKDAIHDISKVESFLDEIIEGNRPFNTITEEIDPKDNEQIVNSNFFEKIRGENKHTVILFSASKKTQDYSFYRILLAAKTILPEISFLTFDISKNDIPDDLPQHIPQPFYLLFKKGSTEPIKLELGTSFENYVEELIQKVGDMKAPNVDYLQMQIQIQEDIQKNRYHK